MYPYITEEYKSFFDKWAYNKNEVYALLHYNNHLQSVKEGGKGQSIQQRIMGPMWINFRPINKDNGRFYFTLLSWAGVQYAYGNNQFYGSSEKAAKLVYDACLKILDLPSALDENPELFYEFHPFVRDILLKNEYIPLIHDIDVHKELYDAKAEIEALKTELANTKEKLAEAESKKGNQLVQELESILTSKTYNPFE